MIETVKNLYLIRHAQPVVVAGTCYGRLDLEVEHEAHEKLIQTICEQVPKHVLLLSSPLQRCLKTATALETHGYSNPVVDEKIAEMHFGQWEGQPWKTIERAQIDAWASDIVNYRPPNGESVRDLSNRALAAMAALDFSTDVALLTHAGIIQVLSKLLRKQPLANFSESKVEYGSITKLTRYERADGQVWFS